MKISLGDYFEFKYLQQDHKNIQKNHDELKMIFAVLKRQHFRKSWYKPKIKLNLINSIILVHFLTKRAGRKMKEYPSD